MHRYDELEKLYYRRKIKKYSLIFSLFLIILSTLYYFQFYLLKKNQPEQDIKFNIKKITLNKKDDNTISAEDKNISNPVKKETNHIAGLSKKSNTVSKEFKKEVNASKKDSNKKSLTPNLSFVVPHINPESVKKETEKTDVKKQIVKKTQKPTVKLPQIKEEKINIKELIASFNKEPKYDTAMVISKYYFDKNDLKNAKLWALKANNIDPSKYQSWKMFALILIKKNDKIKAKEVLQIYLNDYGDNDEIYKLLRSIDE